MTISTNMAGRGTDILLGGNPEYLARAAVAHEELGGSQDPAKEQQILAEFRWLSGSPESIPTEMVTADRVDAAFAEKVAALRLSQQIEGPSDSETEALTMGRLREEAKADARAWVEERIARYATHLKVFEAKCSEEKKKVLSAGGLHVLGTERHESRRVDNQLRGRAGRQGDPGSSHFYLSLDDDLMRIFGGDRLKVMMERLGMEDDVPIEAKMVTKSIANAQKRVEGHNFDIRKNLIEYDDVMNMQRKTVYGLRRRVLGDEAMDDDVLDMIERVVAYLVSTCADPKRPPDDWNLEMLTAKVKDVFGVEPTYDRVGRYEELELKVYETVEARWKEKQASFGRDFVVVHEGLMPKTVMPVTAKIKEPVWRFLLRQVYLEQIDRHWREHLTQMDQLRDGIGLRGYGSRDPKIEYKREAHQLFGSLMREIDHNSCAVLFHTVLMSASEMERAMERQRQAAEAMQRAAQLKGAHDEETSDSVAPQPKANKPGVKLDKPNGAPTVKRTRPGRNDPCWCGSNKKYKKCHWAEDEAAAART